MFNNILTYYKNNQFNEVIKLIDDNETNPQLLELKGLSALKVKDYTCACIVFGKLVELDLRPVNQYHYALANMNSGNYFKAIKGFAASQKEIKLKIPSKINHAVCLINSKQENQATQILEELSIEEPKIKEVWFLLLKVYRKKKDIKKIEKTLKTSQCYIEHTEDWKKSKVYLLFFSKKYSQAIDNINNFFVDKSNEILSLLGKCYTKISKFENAVKVYKEVLLKEQTALNYYNVAAAYSNLTNNNDLMTGMKYADSSLELDNNHHKAYYCKALIAHKIGNISTALEQIDKALNIDTSNNEYLYKKAELLNLMNQHSESLSILNLILESDKDNNIALRLKGIILLQTNELLSSEESLNKALKLDDRDQRALAYFAINKLAQKKQNEVSEFLGVGTLVKEYIFDPAGDYSDIESFNNEFERDIKNHSLLRKEPKGLAARNGYLTDDLFTDKTKSIILFKKLLMQKINEYIDSLPDDMQHHMLKHKTHEFEISSWATWVKGDGFIDKHIHEESWISGAYYCRVPKITDKSLTKQGYFEYGCIPDDIEITIDKERGYIKPVEGKLIIFPSYLYHQTIPHESPDDRISIAFDLTPLSWKN